MEKELRDDYLYVIELACRLGMLDYATEIAIHLKTLERTWPVV